MTVEREDPKLGDVHIPHRLLYAIELTAIFVALITIGILALDSQFSWLRHRPGGQAFDVGEQPVFMVLFTVGALLALRFRLVGGALATFTAAGLIVFTSRQLAFTEGVLIFAGFLIPGLLWVMVGLFELRDERFHRAEHEQPRPLLRRRDVLSGLVVLGLSALGGALLARRLFDAIYGPTHPSSTVAPPFQAVTRWVWSGAVTPTGATIRTRLQDDDARDVTVLVAQDPTLAEAVSVPGAATSDGFVEVEVRDLEPDTRYHYAFRVDGEVERGEPARFRTFPVGPSSFAIVFGSCARTGSNGAVFDTIRGHDPTLVIFDGDLHYADITQDSDEAFRQVLDHTLSRPAQAALWRSCPVAYVWDDHDFGGCDRASGSRDAAMRSYRSYVPHYGVAAAYSSIYQSFSIGRVRFLLTDARSSREAPPVGGSATTMLGQEQKEWLKEELVAARVDHALTVWVNPVPWISSHSPERDDWSVHPEERRELANHIVDNGLGSNLLMLSGDAHMTAIDDGTNSNFSDQAGPGFPVFHAGALDRPGSSKGGPYSHGAFPGGGQFGLVELTDDGDELHVRLSGRDWRDRELVALGFTVA